MRALGLESDKEVAEAISLDKSIQAVLDPSYEKALGVDTAKDAILFIGNRVAHGQVEEYRLQKAVTAIDKNFLPHIGRTEQKRKDKALFLAKWPVGQLSCNSKKKT